MSNAQSQKQSQRGKAPKAGKGVGRKPAPETLKPLNVKIPESCWEWVGNQGNKSAYIARLIAEDRAKSAASSSFQ